MFIGIIDIKLFNYAILYRNDIKDKEGKILYLYFKITLILFQRNLTGDNENLIYLKYLFLILFIKNGMFGWKKRNFQRINSLNTTIIKINF